MPCTRPDFDRALFNFSIFLKLGVLTCLGPGASCPPAPPLSAALSGDNLSLQLGNPFGTRQERLSGVTIDYFYLNGPWNFGGKSRDIFWDHYWEFYKRRVDNAVLLLCIILNRLSVPPMQLCLVIRPDCNTYCLLTLLY